MEQYLAGVASRYTELPPEQQESVSAFLGTEVGQTVSYVLGPEMSGLISQIQPQPQPEPMVEPMPMARGGFVQKRKKSVAKKK